MAPKNLALKGVFCTRRPSSKTIILLIILAVAGSTRAHQPTHPRAVFDICGSNIGRTIG
jgi:hypothetical protein